MVGKKATGALRCAVALSLVASLGVPAQALAATEPVSEPPLAAQATTASLPSLQAQGNVTVIVELDEGLRGASIFDIIGGTVQEARHDFIKNEIYSLADEANEALLEEARSAASAEEAEEAAEGDETGLILKADTSALSGEETDASAEAPEAEEAPAPALNDPVQELCDYYHALSGFAMKVPASLVADIQDLRGVKNVFVETAYEVPVDQGGAEALAMEGDEAEASALRNQNALDATGADKVEQKGDGQVIAIIDTGLDTDHEAFGGDLADDTLALTEADIEAARDKLEGSGGVYVSEKIPFAFDYADGDADVNPGLAGLEHGTHVAGIAAANGGELIRGTAPNAQIVAMKVASDETGYMYDSTILAALDDCAVLLPDSVNISLGSDAGFSDAGNATYAAAISALEQAGVTVNVAAGNSYSAGFMNQSGKNLPYADSPDSSVLSTPASLNSSFAVASVAAEPVEVAGEASAPTAFYDAEGNAVRYWEAAGPDGSARLARFADLAAGDYELVWCDGGSRDGIMGDVEGQPAGCLEGKIALVRGHYDFWGSVQAYSRAVTNLDGLGAEAVVFYDPDLTEEDLATVRIDDDWDATECCPAVFVAAADGERLRDTAASERFLTLKAAAADDVDQEGATAESATYYRMSEFSSWGVTPDLKLKPEVAAPGGNVYSAMPNGEYAYMSGTSMATPQLAGITALMHEYVESESKYAGYNEAGKTALVTQLLMSTARPLADLNDLTSYYSPRQQGAGLVDVEAATTTDVYAVVDGATNYSRPKADLGESAEGTWDFTVMLYNLGDEAHSFAFDGIALSDTVVDGLFQQRAKNWSNDGIAVTANVSDEMTLSPHSSATIRVTVACGEAFTDWARENTPNGTFVDGFARFVSTDGGVDLSVPYCGFYGDWSDAPVFDDTVAGDYHAFGTRLLDASTGHYLGTNPLDNSAYYNEDAVDMGKIVLSDSHFYGAPTSLTIATGLLRNVDELTYELSEEGVEETVELTYPYVPKTYYNATARAFVYAEATAPFGGGAPVLSGADDETPLTLTQKAVTAGPTPEEQTQSFTIQYDLTSPTITQVRYDDNDGAPQLVVTVEDNGYVAAIDFADPDLSAITPYQGFYRVLVDPDEALVQTRDDGTKVYEVTVPVAEVAAHWNGEGEVPATVKAFAWDYGVNSSRSAQAVLAPVAAEAVTLDAAEVALAPGEQHPLTATVAPASSTETALEWSVADESVATVDEAGVVSAQAEGTTTVTVSVAGRPEVSAQATVSVAKLSADEGLRLFADSQTVVTGETTQVRALLSDDLAGATVTWETSDAEVAAIKANEDTSTATVTGAYQAGDATLTARVSTPDGRELSDTMTIQNRPANYEDFVINEDGVLVKYLGVSGVVDIPNNVTELADELFYGDSIVDEVHIPASVKRIGERALARRTITSNNSWSVEGLNKVLVFEDTEEHPSQLESIGAYAFADGGVKGEVYLPDSVTSLGEGVFSGNMAVSYVRLSDNLTDIPDNTFARATGLSRVAMSDMVKRIGNGVFRDCLFMENIDIIGKGTTEPGTIGMPSALEEIGDSAFAAGYLGCDSPYYGAVVSIPAGVKRIESSAFAMNGFLVGVELAEGLESIGQNAFQQTSIGSITLPDSLTSLDWHAFFGMTELTEINLGKNLGEDEFVGAVGAYSNAFHPEGMHVAAVNAPADATCYSSVDGVLYNKDGSKLIYYPAALMGTDGAFAVPEGVTRVAQGAFDDTRLTTLQLPDSVEVVEESSITESLQVLDMGANVVSVAPNAFKKLFYSDDSLNVSNMPAHLIVRGGNNGSYADSQRPEGAQSAYFGAGMTSLSFALGGAPATLVVPADMAELDLSGNAGDPGAVQVWAPAGSAGWQVAEQALAAIGADASKQLHDYEALQAHFTVTSVEDDTMALSAYGTGGVGDNEYRFVAVDGWGRETVVRDWSADAAFTWQANGQALRVDVRDATWLIASTTLGEAVPAVAAAPVIATDLPESMTVQPDVPVVLRVEASSPDGGELSYQWYCDGEPIEGAVEASFVPDTHEAGTHDYAVMVTNTLRINGQEAWAQTASATTRLVVEGAEEPVADKSALAAFIDTVKDADPNAYTLESWEAFAAAFNDAVAVSERADATQLEVNEALSRLQQAWAALVPQQAYDHTALADGTYEVTLSMLSALDVSGESMAAPVLNRAGMLTVADGRYTLEFALNQGASVMGYAANLGDVRYYPDGYTVEAGKAVQKGSPSLATVLEADADGFPTRLSVPLNDQAKTEGGMLLHGAFASMGSQFFVLSIDWAAFDALYGPEEPEPVYADKTALLALIAEAEGLAQGDVAAVDWAVFQRAVAEARAVADELEAPQTAVDAQAKALASALNRVRGRAEFAFQVGGVYEVPVRWVNANGSALAQDLFGATAQVTVLAEGVYEAVITTAAGNVSQVAYGPASVAAEAVSRDDATGATGYALVAGSLTEALKVGYSLALGSFTVPQTGYLLFDTSLVRIVSEPSGAGSEPVAVDKSSLAAVVATASAVTQGQKTDEAWNTFKAALAAARAVLADEQADQASVDAATRQLGQAIRTFDASANKAPSRPTTPDTPTTPVAPTTPVTPPVSQDPSGTAGNGGNGSSGNGNGSGSGNGAAAGNNAGGYTPTTPAASRTPLTTANGSTAASGSASASGNTAGAARAATPTALASTRSITNAATGDTATAEGAPSASASGTPTALSGTKSNAASARTLSAIDDEATPLATAVNDGPAVPGLLSAIPTPVLCALVLLVMAAAFSVGLVARRRLIGAFAGETVLEDLGLAD